MGKREAGKSSALVKLHTESQVYCDSSSQSVIIISSVL